jgi:hypothetical protein
MLFREIIFVYFKNHTKTINTLYVQNTEQLNVEVGGTYNKNRAVKSYKYVPTNFAFS